MEPLLRGRFGRPYLYREVCASTQELVRGLPEGAVAATDEQSAGRGRLGRTWSAPRGTGLLFSLALTPRTPPDRLAPFSLVVADAVCTVAAPRAMVRWPNDVVVEGRKLAGVLVELRDGHMVVGVGINANLTSEQLPTDARVPATSLRIELGYPVDRAAMLADLLAEIERRYDAFEARGFEGLEHDELRGRTVTLRGGAGGRCYGVDSQGRLVVAGERYSSEEIAGVDVD
ncbi:MAG: biotin--[acetyl-CoA-carboxylase] ligase [Gaiellales bacterium]